MDEFVEDYFLANAPQCVKEAVMKVTTLYRVKGESTEHGIYHFDLKLKHNN